MTGEPHSLTASLLPMIHNFTATLHARKLSGLSRFPAVIASNQQRALQLALGRGMAAFR